MNSRPVNRSASAAESTSSEAISHRDDHENDDNDTDLKSIANEAKKNASILGIKALFRDKKQQQQQQINNQDKDKDILLICIDVSALSFLALLILSLWGWPRAIVFGLVPFFFGVFCFFARVYKKRNKFVTTHALGEKRKVSSFDTDLLLYHIIYSLLIYCCIY